MKFGGATVIEADIKAYFDTIDHDVLMGFINQRVRDGVLCKLIRKWLNAGIMDGSLICYPEFGTPQGGVISPLLANIYLHHVLDLWIAEISLLLGCKVSLFRYADDFIILCSDPDVAARIYSTLPKRLEKYGLTLSLSKSKIVPFSKGSKEVFTFLAFQYYWGRSKKGYWIVKLRSDGKRMRSKLKSMKEFIRNSRHKPIEEQYKAICRRLTGYRAYHGITFNSDELGRYFRAVCRMWIYWLNRRSGRRNTMPWRKFTLLLERYPLPRAVIVKSIFAASP